VSQCFQPNGRVLHRGHSEYGFGIIRYVEEDPFGESRLQVAFDHLDNLESVAPGDVEPVCEPHADAADGRWGDIAAFRRKLSAGLVLAENNITGGFTKSAVQPLPHQAFLLDKVLSGDRFGHVLADDVGLGKTIEAGLLITCLMRREPPQRIMIVCPAGLALQWKDELDEHFGLTFTIVGEEFDGKSEGMWRTQTHVIAPLDRIKREEYRELLKAVGVFDLVVCDEAHRLTARRQFLSQKLEKTANYELFEFLVKSRLIRYVENNDQAPRSPRLLLLSATPHQGDDERFLHLLHLARPDLFDPGKRGVEQLVTPALVETLTRTPKSRAVDWDGKPLFKGHATQTIDIHWTVAETGVSRLLTEYILKSLDFARESDRSRRLVIQLVMHTFHKLAASSWAALERALQARLEALDGKVQKLNELLAGTAPDEGEDTLPRDFVVPAKAFFENERQLLQVLLDRLRALRVDSKWERCRDLLTELDRAEAGVKVLLFTQYRVTQRQLQERLQQQFPGTIVEVIHGDVPMEERKQARIRFEDQSRFLVSTEAGGEGINLQRACHVMINYDLPWNPMRLQQRIGRLDRYGQQRVVQAFNLRVPDSWGAQIATRIDERLAVIQRTMALAGSGALEDYHEMIVGKIVEQVEAASLFAEAQTGHEVSDADVDDWIRGAMKSVERWRGLFSNDLGLSGDPDLLRPSLGSEHLKAAYRYACEHHGIQFRESRNHANQFLSDVFNFDLPGAFRDPIFRPSRTVHVVFDRDRYAAVRGQDLGRVRGQTIRPLLAGFGEPFTDWLFQTAMHARAGESAFVVQASKDWTHGPGWVLVFALRWLGKVRRLMAPDSLHVVHADGAGEVRDVTPADAAQLAAKATVMSSDGALLPDAVLATARQNARQALKRRATTRGPSARGAAGMSLLMVCRIIDANT